MADSIKIVYRSGEGELIEKKSRFIATVAPVETEDQALAFIERMRKKYWDASHNCYAYIVGGRGELKRCSDDGEPSQTAGRPMLDVLIGEELCNVCVVVTRYFGGTLLGTGGLVRAYSGAVKEGLAHSKIVKKCPGWEMHLICSYTDVGKIQYILGQRQIPVLESQYTDTVTFRVLSPEKEADSLEEALVEGTNARVRIERTTLLYYGMVDKEVVVFEEIPLENREI